MQEEKSGARRIRTADLLGAMQGLVARSAGRFRVLERFGGGFSERDRGRMYADPRSDMRRYAGCRALEFASASNRSMVVQTQMPRLGKLHVHLIRLPGIGSVSSPAGVADNVGRSLSRAVRFRGRPPLTASRRRHRRLVQPYGVKRLLGMETLSRFRAIELDWDDHEISLQSG